MQKHKFKFFRGDDVSYRLLFRLPNGEAVNLDGIRLDLHAMVEGKTEPQIELSTQNGGVSINTEGEVLINFSHADTQDVDWEIANYDLQLTDTKGKRKTVLYGTIQLIPDQTQI
ncbi:MAG: hypothetical protein SOS93_05835 [Mannheimia varigena]|nr:hypothetical protein [Mannheimia varigena]